MKNHLIFDTTDASTILDSDSVGAFLRDAAGNLITSQANGAQQALDVGINVAGVQIDPRQIRALASGTDSVTAIQGTSPWITKDQADGPVSPGTAASFSQLGGGVYNSSAPTLTNGQQAALQMDASGNLKVVIGSGGNLSVDLNGIYNVSTNPTPDNVGLISFVRAATPGLSDQTFTGTGGVANADGVVAANVHGLDVNAFGMLYNGTTWDRMTGTGGNLNVNIASGTVTTSDAALANVAVASNTNTLAVAGTAQAAVASPQSNRKYLWIYNFSNNQIFIGGASVTAANGFPISPGAYLELRAGAASPVNFIGQTGKTPEIRTLQLS